MYKIFDLFYQSRVEMCEVYLSVRLAYFCLHDAEECEFALLE
jgi:hypothetical protein